MAPPAMIVITLVMLLNCCADNFRGGGGEGGGVLRMTHAIANSTIDLSTPVTTPGRRQVPRFSPAPPQATDNKDDPSSAANNSHQSLITLLALQSAIKIEK